MLGVTGAALQLAGLALLGMRRHNRPANRKGSHDDPARSAEHFDDQLPLIEGVR
jgi:hypothetical protein